MLAGFAARGRSRLNCRKHTWTAPVELTAVQSGPWLYRESTAPPRENAETKQSERGPPQDSQRRGDIIQTKQTKNEFKGGKRREGDGDKISPTTK